MIGPQTASEALQPRPLGVRWGNYAGISLYGATRRAWRVNQLRRGDLRSVLGLSVRAGDDLFNKSLSSPTLANRLKDLYPALEPELGSNAVWWPFGGPVPGDTLVWSLRECPTCARSGYHSLLFQMPGIERCPWHRQALIEACPACEWPLDDGLRHGLPPGRCTCGHDLVDEVQTLTGDGFGPARRDVIRIYLGWVDQTRERHWLVAPEALDVHGWQALARLLPPLPSALNQSSPPALEDDTDMVREDVAFHNFARHAATRLGENSGLEGFTSRTASLPLAWLPPIRDIGQRLWRELVSVEGGTLALATGELRATLLGLPVYPCGRTLLLQTECLDRAVLRVLSRLVGAMQRTRGTARFPVIEAFSTWLHQDPVGPLLAEKVVQRVLGRGYAQGARIALGRHVPALYGSAKRPTNRYPWIVLRMQPGVMPSARLVWTRQFGTL